MYLGSQTPKGKIMDEVLLFLGAISIHFFVWIAYGRYLYRNDNTSSRLLDSVMVSMFWEFVIPAKIVCFLITFMNEGER